MNEVSSSSLLTSIGPLNVFVVWRIAALCSKPMVVKELSNYVALNARDPHVSKNEFSILEIGSGILLHAYDIYIVSSATCTRDVIVSNVRPS